MLDWGDIIGSYNTHSSHCVEREEDGISHEVNLTLMAYLLSSVCADIKHMESLSALSKCPRLRMVYIASNPVTSQSEFHQHCLGQALTFVL